jgi:exodeoxyribonuclease VII large subunit
VRALTPSEAAERVVPSAEDLRAALDGYRQRLFGALRSRALDARSRLDALAQHRAFRKPYERVHDLSRQLDELDARAQRALKSSVSRLHERLIGLAGRLESLSPLAVLQRGYSLTQRSDDGGLVTDAATLAPGDRLTSRLARGSVITHVHEILPETPSPRASGAS